MKNLVTHLTFVSGLMFPLNAFAASDSESTSSPSYPPMHSTVEGTVDCTHNFNFNKGATQDCVNLTQLKLSLDSSLSKNVIASLTLDPYGSPIRRRESLPSEHDFEIPGRDGHFNYPIDQYRLLWKFRPNLNLSIEKFSGTTDIPSLSGLASASSFNNAPWDQTAIVAEYHLPPLDGVTVTLAVGNGEGEMNRNLDPQQYGGVAIIAGLTPGIKTKLGLSYDGNNAGSESYTWMFENNGTANVTSLRGFSTQRMVGAFMLDGNAPGARGLKAAVAIQKTIKNDLDKSVASVPTDFYDTTLRRFDLSDIFIENPDNKSESLETLVFNANASLQILAKYFIAVDYESRTTKTSSLAFFIRCADQRSGTCQDLDGRTTHVLQTAYTLGGGIALDEGLRLTVEYHASSYDKLYANFNYQQGNEKYSRSREIFNARLEFHL